MILTNKVGKGNVILFGFCMQDTYFQACKTDDETTLNALYTQVHNAFAEMELYLIYIPPIQK